MTNTPIFLNFLKWIARVAMIGIGLLMALGLMEVYFRQTIRFHPPLTECHDEYTFQTRANLNVIDNNPGEFRARYQTNAQRLRNDSLQEDAWRVLGVGDSFTFGMGVDNDETYLSILEQNLIANSDQPVQVLNSGVIGWGTSHELLYLEQEGFAYDPDLIVVGFYIGNDLGDNQSSQIYQRDDTGGLVLNPPSEREAVCDTTSSQLSQLPFYDFFAARSATLAWVRQYVANQQAYSESVAEESVAEESTSAIH